MKFLLFSVLLILALYSASIIVMIFLKCRQERANTLLSRDVANVCKGFAIGIIMLAHIGNTFGVRYLTPLGSWGVGIFLFLSGYGLKLSAENKGLQGFWKKRILTAWLPYVAAEIIGILLCVTPEYSQLRLQDVVLDMLLIKTLHPFGWYMQCLFLYYIAFYLSHKLFEGNKIGSYSVLLALSVVFFVFFRSLFKQQIFTFIFGVLTADCLNIREKIIKKPLVGSVILMLGAALLATRQLAVIRSMDWLYELLFSAQVLCLVVGTVSFVGWLYSKAKPLLFEPALLLGVISFEIYLYHGWILNWIAEQTISYPLIVVFFIGSIALSIPIYFAWHGLVAFSKKLRKFSET